MAAQPVQRLTDGNSGADRDRVQNVARQGTADGGSSLPHGATIQRLFGRHDVGGVKAHVGGPAEAANRALGAEAYATGDHVAFAGTPDLQTAAHEAAHVGQQRGGVALAGWIDGGQSDSHEQHANEVADLVSRGESAEVLLDHVAGGGADRTSIAPVQRAPAKPDAANPPASPSPPGARDLDVGLAAGRRAIEMIAVARTLLPAYLRAVGAFDPMAALELAHTLISALHAAEDDRRDVTETLGSDPPQHWMVSTPGKPEQTEAQITSKWAELGKFKQRILAELPALEAELAVKIGPQLLDGLPVLGGTTQPKLDDDALAYFVSEAGVVVELLGVVAEVMRISGARVGTCPAIPPAKAQQVKKLVEPWKSRPVNFAFLVAALRKIGVWDEVSAARADPRGNTLADTNSQVAAQAKQTGALADIGDLDTAALDHLLQEVSPGWITPGVHISDETAQRLFERLINAAADARGPLIKQIQRMGKLDHVCDHLPRKTIQAIHDAVAPFDAEAAALLVPFYAGKGGGTSLHKVYEYNIMEDVHDEKYVRAYLWTFLSTAHNALTGGFEREYSEAYDAREAGLITDEAFHSAAGKALGKAAAISMASAATGGVAGEFGEGLAAGLGASKSAASIIGAGIGGFGAGVGGHLAGDVYDQALNGKQGFDALGSYMKSGAEGGIMGTVLGGISVGAGKYLGEGGTPMRQIDDMAARYPKSASVLERLRGAGFQTGAKVRVGSAAAMTKIKVTAAELADMITSGLAVPRPQLALSIGKLPPGEMIEISARPRPMQTSAHDKPTPGMVTPSTGGKHESPKLELEEIEPVSESGTSATDQARELEEIKQQLASPKTLSGKEKQALRARKRELQEQLGQTASESAAADIPTPTRYKVRASGLTGKEAATDVPSWIEKWPDARPGIDENGTTFATRMMNKKYGAGGWEKVGEHNTEFSQLKKFGDRAFE